MALIIATDEAGYGPKLGPLVVAATIWELQDSQDLQSPFAPLITPVADARCGRVFVDDSKRVFKRRSTSAVGTESPMTDVVCQAASHWAGLPCPISDFQRWLGQVVPNDLDSIDRAPWFGDWRASGREPSHVTPAAPNQKLIRHWSSFGVSLRRIRARFITAAAFNARLAHGGNKADLLIDMTCSMVAELLEQSCRKSDIVRVFSDRLGGRAYYAAALQHHVNSAIWEIENEGRQLSRYRICRPIDRSRTQDVDWSFTVKGDSYAPVAMSSMIAKWLRERAMRSFNQFFGNRTKHGDSLRPTAGYPSDATRYLVDLRRLGLLNGIDDAELIRVR